MAKPVQKACSSCGTVGLPVRYVPGSFLIEVGLFIMCCIVTAIAGKGGIVLFGIPVIYSVWRLVKAGDACPACKSLAVVPLDTPVGQQIAARLPR